MSWPAGWSAFSRKAKTRLNLGGGHLNVTRLCH
jgi:hypothetical protein